jgi:hypothetical protein
MNRRLLLALMGGLPLAGGAAFADSAPTPTRLRGTIDSVAADGLVVTTQDGAKTHVTLASPLRVAWVVPAQFSDIAPGRFVEIASLPQPDGTLRAMEVLVFPAGARGSSEGYFGWDLAPSSMMTNGTVGGVVGSSGRTVTVNYGTGDKQIVIPDQAPIVSFQPADRDAITAGAHVLISGSRDAEGAVTASSVSVGKDGLVPPM